MVPTYKMMFTDKNLKIEPFLAFKGDILEFSLFIILKALNMKINDAM